jgi:hypothetical protein
VERKTDWISGQFIGRIGHCEKLPDHLAEVDLAQVAATLLPEGIASALKIPVGYAQGSAKYLAGIESAVRRARYLAGQEGRSEATDKDIVSAIRESVIPSDSALATALAVLLLPTLLGSWNSSNWTDCAWIYTPTTSTAWAARLRVVGCVAIRGVLHAGNIFLNVFLRRCL